jgi:hypothetical protein
MTQLSVAAGKFNRVGLGGADHEQEHEQDYDFNFS